MPIVFALILLLTPLAAQVAHAEQWTTYTDKEAGFSVSYPADWQAKSTPMPEAELKVKAPGGTAPTICMFAHTLLDSTSGLTPEMALKTYSPPKFIEAFRTIYDEVVLIQDTRQTVSGHAAAYMEASYRKPQHGTEKGVFYRTQQLYTVVGGGPYLVRCAVPVADADTRSEPVRRILESFHILH